jgi:hypothetical protein
VRTDGTLMACFTRRLGLIDVVKAIHVPALFAATAERCRRRRYKDSRAGFKSERRETRNTVTF